MVRQDSKCFSAISLRGNLADSMVIYTVSRLKRPLTPMCISGLYADSLKGC